MVKLNTTNQMVRAFGKVLEMKPETIARRAAKRVADKSASQAFRIERLKAMVERDGPDSIWSEMLIGECA